MVQTTCRLITVLNLQVDESYSSFVVNFGTEKKKVFR